MIVVHFIRVERIEQALKMIESMPVVAAYARIERRREPGCVGLVVQRAQKHLALSQHLGNSVEDYFAVHSRSPMTGTECR